MTPRILTALLALALAGDSAIETDPFLAALDGKSGKDAVAAPTFDAELEAVWWSPAPRREAVTALAARLLRGEAGDWFEPAKDLPVLPSPPSRVPVDFDPGNVEVADRLATRVPTDAAAVFFGSLKEAGTVVAELATFLPRNLPQLCGETRGSEREALRRAVDMLLLPTIWRSNPEAPTGTRQVALVVADLDLRWAPDIALVCEVDDASLVRAHRQATFSWEERGNRRIRVDGLDAVADDGSVRSFFALEGGTAVWSTTKSLRERILETASGKAPSLLSPPAREYACARKTFPKAEGGALLVVPDGFLTRASSAGARARRAAALRCEAVLRILDARSRTSPPAPLDSAVRLSCPSEGVLRPGGRGAPSSCSVHGSADAPVPGGDLPTARIVAADARVVAGIVARPDHLLRGGLPLAARWREGQFEFLVPPTGLAFRDLLEKAPDGSHGDDGYAIDTKDPFLRTGSVLNYRILDLR